ncbi:MAG: glycosyltransferase family 4 protein [Candidatus Dormibacteraeota bacterium]|nr:glycosyltransferase family 4 protein [Candidatus Dormibacteraeota bacterium]
MAEVSRSPRPVPTAPAAPAAPAALRILMLSHIPLVRELGEGRVCLELAEEFRKLGHTVETFDSTDAFPGQRPRRWHRLLPLRFAGPARDFVRRHGTRFDVVDALQGVGPLPKRRLGFDGLVVSRSAGLYAFYLRDLERQRAAWPERLPGTRTGQLLARVVQRRAAAACEQSMLSADLVNVPNEDERGYLSEQLGIGDRCVVNPLGISAEHAAALAAYALTAAERLERKEVVFIGAWSLRKGAADWGAIVRRTRELAPGAGFRFLGTGVAREAVLADLGLPSSERVTVVPRYPAAELPSLLGPATVGALPSYIEGWGLGVLEQLAAGIPTVAYDVSGPRSMLAQLDRKLLCPAGDVERFSRLLAHNLTQAPAAYAGLGAQCREVASRFLWPDIARQTLDRYAEGLDRVRDAIPARA